MQQITGTCFQNFTTREARLINVVNSIRLYAWCRRFPGADLVRPTLVSDGKGGRRQSVSR